ncbi:ATP-dependent DNA ligase [Nakamurella sp. YIM 132087]|uniref:ATP-dependent DNA ligase n=1 Tax=Nakamurella alba TaxID=2665158 RepID=A0A7K1FI42_9ACTN|nr:ATP-dependent DNA ligase [Nakamurella alba]MTD13791.1 ATP-dependent DNA ligase [Nakamurella alba]
MASKKSVEIRDDVELTNLDEPLADRGGPSKRVLVDYLDAASDRLIPALAERPVSVIRVRPGQPSFMQKNLPTYTPAWVRSTTVWAEASKREIRYALCEDRRTLLWLGNQRAVEFHVPLVRVGEQHQTHLVLDLDPPEGAGFDAVVAVAKLVRQALADAGLDGAVKTSGAKGLHIFVPLQPLPIEDAAAATRALAARTAALDPSIATTAYLLEEREGKVFVDATRAGGATVVAAWSPRLRPGLPVSYPLSWDELDGVHPSDFTCTTVASSAGPGGDPWVDLMPEPQRIPDDVLEQGRQIPIARVVAMHEGKRRKRAREAAPDTP